jgi:predicted RNase H-like nuclease (RuvC/YqgF family)
MFSILAAALLIVSGCWIYNLTEQNTSLRYTLQRYSSITSQENFENELQEKIHYSQHLYSSLDSKVEQLKHELVHLEKELDFQYNGFYWAKDISISSEEYSNRLDDIRLQQKAMAENNLAMTGSSWLQIEQRKGEKLLTDLRKAILSLFDEQCKKSISKVKVGKFDDSWREIQRAFRSSNRLSVLIGHSINEDYLKLKENELRIKYKYEVKFQEEKEIEKQYQDDEREQLKRERDIKKAEEVLRETEEQERTYQKKLDEINRKLELDFRDKLSLAEGERVIAIKEAESLKLKIEELQEEIQKEKEQIGDFKRGYIFVLSNVSFFRDGIYRICSTTSADEHNYIRNMNVHLPFPFSIHFKFFSEDVNKTVNILYDRAISFISKP